MVLALIGESCTGKSEIADLLKIEIGASVYTGKDYLRLAGNESEAKKIFADLLIESQDSKNNLIYVISEKEQLGLLPEKAYRVVLKADLETIKQRFSKRKGGNMPPPVAGMLEKKHGMFDATEADLVLDTTSTKAEENHRKIVLETTKNKGEE